MKDRHFRVQLGLCCMTKALTSTIGLYLFIARKIGVKEMQIQLMDAPYQRPGTKPPAYTVAICWTGDHYDGLRLTEASELQYTCYIVAAWAFVGLASGSDDCEVD